MDKTIMLTIMVSILTTACTDQGYPDDDRFQAWRIGAAISHEFPALIYEAYGVNEEEDWTSMMLPYTGNMASSSRLNMDHMRRYTYPEYDGYVLPLTGAINFTPNQLGLGKKSLPDELYVYWQPLSSLINYTTVVEVTPQIKAAMVKPYPHPSWRFEGQNCYQTDFIFGLLPDGRAKLWLRGCDYYTFIDEYKPTQVMPPKDPSLAKNKPIPWDKVNQVWYHKNYKVQNLEDVVQTDSNGRITYVDRPAPPAPEVEETRLPSRCWADRPVAKSVAVSRTSAEYKLQRLFWNNASKLMGALSREEDSDTAVLQAWKEAKQKGLSDDDGQVWVAARLVTLADYSVETIVDELSLSEEAEIRLKQYVDEMCGSEYSN